VRRLLSRLAVHRKLMAMLMITSGMALLLASTMSILYAFFQVREDVAVNLGSSARLVLSNTRVSVSFEDSTDALQALEALRSNPSIRLACLYRPEGALLAAFRPDSVSMCPPKPPPAGYSYSGGRLELIERDVVPDGQPGAWVLIQSDLALLTDRLRGQATITLVVFAVALLLAFVLSSVLQRIVSQPVVELAQLTQAVSATGDYSRRVEKRSEDELGMLADSINGMFERITLVESERQVALEREREANRAKDEFLATLSHELRTPLSAILGWTQLMRRKLVPPEEFARGLERIERNAHAQNRLINDLLDLSRILSGKMSLQRQAADLTAITRVIVESMLPLAQAQEIALHADLGDQRLLAFIDADRISQVATNLLTNALKFTPHGGTVTVTTRRVGEMVELAVSDTGAGIAPDFLPRVFEPFRQADASHTRKHGGLGLGLAIVKRITEMHGGDVNVESAGVGAGSRFTIRLPAAVEPAVIAGMADDANSAGTTPDLSALAILIVDDDADTRELVRIALTRTGARLSVASSSAEGLAAALSGPPDVLITDIAMPLQDGHEMVQRLRESLGPRTPKVIIALSAFAAEKDAERSLSLGFDAHVTKPFEPDFLVATIHERVLEQAEQKPLGSDRGQTPV
jgi:signal transduction histidine kinase/CheY-like chemotaxis protein